MNEFKTGASSMEEKRLPNLLVHSYGFASMTFSLMMSLALNYYTIFLTDVAMISAVHVGTIMFITHVVDALSIPISGSIIQRTQFRWGQFRSWLLFIPLSTCIFFTLTFTNLPLDYWIKIFYLSGAYVIAHVSLNFAFNGHLGLISVLSGKLQERARLSARNVQYTVFAQVLFSVGVIPMLTFFSKSNESRGFFYTVAILSVVQVIGYWNLFWRTKDYDRYDPDKKLNPLFKMTVREMLSQIYGNRQLLILMVAECVRYVGMFSIISMAVYYFKYAARNAAFMSPYTLCVGIAAFLGTVIGPVFIKKFGKKPMYLFATLCGVLGYTVLYFFGASSAIVYTEIVCCASFGVSLINPVIQAMYMDTAEYGIYRTGKNANAFIMSMNTLPIKIGIAMALTIIPYALGYIGYVANMEATPEFINNLMKIIAFLPVLCFSIAAVMMSFYSLTDSKVAEYMKANAIAKAEGRP
jgi:GPH family glycoside/pentoside/hexuronide:cation symporter